MNDRVEFVDYPNLWMRLGEFLESKGFERATELGLPVKHLDLESAADDGRSRSALGGKFHGMILRDDPDPRPATVFWAITVRQLRRRFLGTIWIDDAARGAHARSWVIEIYGREHVEMFMKLAGEIEKQFNVWVSVRLQCEERRYEDLRSDYV